MNDKEKLFTSKTGQKYIINTPKAAGQAMARTADNIAQKSKEIKKK